MIIERELHPDLRAMLMANEPFEYAHLIKFERPSRPDTRTGRVSTAAIRYTYLTDASRDIGFDDGSKDYNGNSNGTQSYLANKVIKVAEVSESIEAKASNFNLTLDGNGLGATIPLMTITITALVNNQYDFQLGNQFFDPIAEGFREGDKVSFYGSGNFIGSFNIDSFRSNNVIRFNKIDSNIGEGSIYIEGKLDSEEIKSILLDKNVPEYASFINREVFIYKVYQQNGTTVGAPVLIFKGNISNVSFEDGDKGIIVSWGLTSQWGDFAQVKGRITSDDFHRALDQNGNPQPESALKIEYAYDKGFAHSETSINLLANYLVQVEKQDIKAKRGFFGIGAKVKVKKYFVSEGRTTQLDFQLAAKSIPLHYGVKVTTGQPIFADTLKNDSSTVYVAYVLGEGQMGGIYDVIIDDKSLICNDKSDFDARNKQTADNTVALVCRGRADRGDVLGGTENTNIADTPIDFYGGDFSNLVGFYGFNRNLLHRTQYLPYRPPVEAAYSTEGKGVIDGESISLKSPITMTLDFFGGSEGQKASSQLVEIAKAGNFKIQSSYWKGSEVSEYWGPNHRLVDTAYVIAKYKIAEGETSIPELTFVVKTKLLNCYNYDYSYAHSIKLTTESPDNFALGSAVDLYRSDTTAAINVGVQIIDKWTFTNADGIVETRFRFSSPPNLNYVDGVPSITKFYMLAGANRWTMTTYNYVEHSGSVGAQVMATVTPVSVGGNYAIPITGTLAGVGEPGQPAPVYSVFGSSSLISGYTVGGNLVTNYNYLTNNLRLAQLAEY